MISRRHLLAAGGLTALVAAGCSPADEPAPSPDPAVTVGLTYIPNVQFCAFYLGLKEGLFEGVDVTIRHHGEQEDLFGALARDQEQLVYASSDEAVVAGQELVTVATSYQRYPVEVLFLGQAGDLSELRGKTLGIPGRFGSSYYAALAAMESAGLTEDDLTLQEIGYTQVSAMATGKVDAIMGFTNNELVQLEMMGVEVSRVPISDEPMLVGPGLITTPDRADEPAVAAVVAGLLAAERRVVEDPAAAIEATKEHVPALADPAQLEMAQRVLEATIELWRDPSGEVSVDVDPAAMRRMEEFLTGAGIVSG